jgi:type II secretory pathway pseudopilin PulG
MCSNKIAKPSSRSTKVRNEKGVYLVELLVAVFISSLFAAAVASSMADSTRLTTSSQNQVLAANIAQELIDNARNTPFNTLATYCQSTPYALLVNKTSSAETGPAVQPRPLLLDMSSHTWSTDSKRNLFRGTVTELVQGLDTAFAVTTANPPPYIRVTITITWIDGSTTNNKTYSLQTLISEQGIHN